MSATASTGSRPASHAKEILAQHGNKILFVLLSLVFVLMLLASWFVAERLVLSELGEIVKHDQQELESKADYLAGNIMHHLHHLQNVPSLTAKEPNVLKALSVGTDKYNSLTQEQRKKIWSGLPSLKAEDEHLTSLAGYMSAGVIYVLIP
ncbi:MAG: hypothetical protein OEV35_08530, partial [Gallionellaceae bacterium]|nr:hypothetical protein [Gallionellaceae bacterium]